MRNYIYEDNLESKRLTTRKLDETDILVWKEFFEDRETIELLNFSSLDLKSTYELSDYMIKKQIQRYQDNRFGLQALIEKKTKTFVGLCGLLSQDVDQISEVEVGYHILKKFRKNGFATEAAKIFIDYAFKKELTSSVISVINIENINSKKVALKNGLTLHKETKWLNNESVYIYRIIKEDWEKNGGAI